MKSFFFALMEVERYPEENEGQTFVKAMTALREAGNKIGTVTYYRVEHESQYRKAENELKAQVK